MNGKKLKLITEIIAIIIICLISFVGIYTQKANKMANIVKDYSLGKDFKGYRELIFKVSDAVEVTDKDGKIVGNTDNYTDSTIESYSYIKTENKVNSEEDLTEKNYKKSKKIVEERLKKLNIQDYNLSQDETTGMIYLQIPEDSETEHVISNILQNASLTIKDSKDSEKVFITNKNVKDIKAVYNTQESGTIVYLQMEFDKEGKNILKEISTGEYAKKEENTENTENENSETENENLVEAEAEVSTEQTETSSEESENTEGNKEEESNQKEITLSIDENSMITTSFDEPIENGIINLSMNAATKDTEEINKTLQSASTISLLVKTGPMPITYTVQANRYVDAEISETNVKNIKYIAIGVLGALVLYLIIKYKLRGLIAAIAYIGFLAIYLLIIRYANVQLTISGIVAGIIVLIMNYIFINNLLKIKEENPEVRAMLYNKHFKNTIIKMLMLLIISIIFTFIKWTAINVFGMVAFWGIICMLIYNYLLTQDMIS